MSDTARLADCLHYWSLRTPTAHALETPVETVTWKDLETQVGAIGRLLRSHGVQPGDRLGYLCENSADLIRFILATLRIHAVAVPLNPRLPAVELNWLADDAELTGVLTDQVYLATTQELAAHRPMHIFWTATGTTASGEAATTAGPTPDGVIALLSHAASTPDGHATSNPDEHVTADTDKHATPPDSELALISYTSGTTGRPKGAMLSHTNLVAAAQLFALTDDMTRFDRSLQVLPMAFTGSIVAGWLPTLFTGATLVLHPAFDPRDTLDALIADRITVFTGVPVVFEKVAALPDFDAADLSLVRLVKAGGAPPAKRISRHYTDRGLVLVQGLGQTESAGIGTSLPVEATVSKEGSAGVPMWNTEVTIVRPDGTRAVADKVGEILFRGPSVMLGYLNNPQSTAETLVNGWLHTGDLGSLDADGYLWVSGRSKEMILSGGLNVYPAEIERVLLSDPRIAEAAVIGVPDAKWGEVPAAVVTGTGLDEAALRELCRSNLGHYKVPKHFIIRDAELPRTMSGKLSKPDIRTIVDAETQPQQA